jgi:hypothetical protein
MVAGAVTRFFLGATGFVVISDPELVHEITITATEKFPNRPHVKMYSLALPHNCFSVSSLIILFSTQHSLGLLQARDEYWYRPFKPSGDRVDGA